MPTNFYFNNFESSQEQNLIEDLIIESIRVYGHNIYYLPRTVVENDPIFKEDDISQYNAAIMMEVYIKNVDGFQGEGDFLSKFGLEIRDEITFTMAKKTYEDEVYYANRSDNIRPAEGDLIYFPLNQKLFQIKFVEHEAIFYQLGKIQTYDLVCELWEQSEEQFDTGVDIIDQIEDDYSQSQTLYVTGIIGDFTLSETVRQLLPLDSITHKLAAAEASISLGEVSSITITDSGAGYSERPLITISSPNSEDGQLSLNFNEDVVSSISIDNPGRNYITAPIVTIDSPNTTPQLATAGINMDDQSLGEIVMTTVGSHYIEVPSVSIVGDQQPPENWSNTNPKFGTHSYKLGSNTSIDQPLESFNVTTSNFNDVSLSFFVYIPGTITTFNKLIALPSPVDPNGDNSFFTIGPDTITWRVRKESGDPLYETLTSYTGTIRTVGWHFVQLVKKNNGTNTKFSIRVDGAEVASTSINTLTVDASHLLRGNLILINSRDSGIEIDDIVFHNSSESLPVPTQARTTSSVNINVENFVVTQATAVANVVDYRVVSVNIVEPGNYYAEKPTVVIDAPTGTPDDFVATAEAVINNTTGSISSVNIIDGGKYYTGSEQISVTSAPNVTATAESSIVDGRLTNITITNAGDGYLTAPTITIATPYSPYITGKVVSLQQNTEVSNAYTIELSNITSDYINTTRFANGNTIIGLTSSATGTIETTISENHPTRTQSDEFQTAAASFIDFSESDPFSEGGSY